MNLAPPGAETIASSVLSSSVALFHIPSRQFNGIRTESATSCTLTDKVDAGERSRPRHSDAKRVS